MEKTYVFPDINNICLINGNIRELDKIEQMSIEQFANLEKPNMPTKFYKYYSNTLNLQDNRNYSIEALESNEVYLNKPSLFDDVFDSEISITLDEFEENMIKTLMCWSNCKSPEKTSINDMINEFIVHVNTLLQEKRSLNNIFETDQCEEAEKLQAEIIAYKWMIESKRYDLTTALLNVIKSEYREFSDKLQNVFRVACFSSTPMSQLMWGGAYANEHRGFCLEYTVQPDKKYENLIQNVWPVIYSKRRRTVTNAIMEVYFSNWKNDALRDLYLNGVLRKSIDWAYQYEWRLVLPPQKDQEAFQTEFFPITKVFLGNRMEIKERKKIIDICKRKNIPYTGVLRSRDYFEMKECEYSCENC